MVRLRPLTFAIGGLIDKAVIPLSSNQSYRSCRLTTPIFKRGNGAHRGLAQRCGESMLTKAETLDLIHEHLGHTPRAADSRLVAHVMRELAACVHLRDPHGRAAAIAREPVRLRHGSMECWHCTASGSSHSTWRQPAVGAP